MSQTVGVALTIAAAGALAGLLVLAIRITAARRRTVAREPESEPASPTRPAWTPRRVRVHLVRLLVHRRRPPVHIGATASWSPIRSVTGVGTAPELTTVPMQMAADHQELAGISAALDAFGEGVEQALDRFLRDDPLTRVRLASSVEQTDQFDATELRQLLAAEDELLAVAR